MVLYLKCRGYGIGLDLPTTPETAASRLATLREGLDQNTPVKIDGASSPVTHLDPYIQHADLENEADLQMLNTLAERINGMTQEEQRLFSGVLELECTGSLDDAVRMVNGLDRYEIFPKIKTDEDLGRFLVDTSFVTGKFSFPEETRPYLDYARIGAEQRDSLGGVYTPHGLVKRREESPIQKETPSTITLTLMTSERSDTLLLPASEEQLEQAKRDLEIDDFSQAVIAGVDYKTPCLEQLIPRDCITVEYVNEMALCLRRLNTDGETMKYCAALEVEEPATFTEALDMAIDIDDYELISSSEREYGRQALRRMGANDEVLEAIEGYTDFDRLGSEMMETDGVRQTGFGLVRRLSKPFPPGPEIGQAMM